MSQKREKRRQRDYVPAPQGDTGLPQAYGLAPNLFKAASLSRPPFEH